MLDNGRPATSVTTTGANELDITEYAQGVVGGGVLLDIPRLRGVPWLEPGTAATRAELEDAERAAGVRLGEGGLARVPDGAPPSAVGDRPWDNGYSGSGAQGHGVPVQPLRGDVARRPVPARKEADAL